MKKRILALALAGTTAFSVFSAAISASAVVSGETAYDIDEYVTYNAVDSITVADSKNETDNAEYKLTLKTGEVIYTGVGTADVVTSFENYYYKSKEANDDRYYSESTWMTVYGGDAYAVRADVAAGKLIAYNSRYLVPTGDVYTISNGNMTNSAAPVYRDGYTDDYEAVNGKLGDNIEGLKVSKTMVALNAPTGNITYSVNGTEVAQDKENNAWNLTLSDVMSTTVVPGTVYLYDFWDTNAALTYAVYSEIAKANGSEALLAATIKDTAVALSADLSYSKYAENRYEVINAWYGFMSELGLLADPYSYFFTDRDDFKSNYSDMFYLDPIYNEYNGKWVRDEKVDVYNIDGLLNDIWAASQNGTWATMNTSELVYLMQQYNKYIGEYIDMNTAEGTEWGELLATLLQAPTAEDFAHPSVYRRYATQAEELIEKYETATSAAQVTLAEEAMYRLLVNHTGYAAKTAGADETELNATVGSLFWNIKAANIPATYFTTATVAGKGVADKDLTGTTYVLYPMSDFDEYKNENEVYSGNKGTAAYRDGESTDEYEWFYNVYELASAMNGKNALQGAIDGVNAALVEAIAALEVTDTPRGSVVAAMEETAEDYEGKIDTDYKASYYAYYTTAYAFADVAEGDAQTKNAEAMIKEAGETLEWQSAQVIITKNDIDGLKDMIDDAEDAIDAIKNSDEYNAAQVTALNKAIATAQGWVDMYEGDHGKNIFAVSVNKTNAGTLVGDKDQMVQSDIAAAIEAIEEAINYATVIEGWSKNADGAWQYGEDGAYVEDGWKKIDGLWYYFEDGAAAQSTWKKLDGKWYYLNKNCAAAYGWCKVDGEWYYFDGDCSMAEGWRKVDGNWYYLTPNEVGKMVTGKQVIDGVEYTFSTEANALGQML